jgi:uncharacterized protein
MGYILSTLIFFAIAVVYSIVGLGGSSSYLAVMVLMDVPQHLIPKIALTCNLIVVTAGSYHFGRAGYFSTKVLLPFAASSVPVAFVAATFTLSREIFVIVLAVTLLLAGLRLLLTPRIAGRAMAELPAGTVWRWGLPLGAVLGAIAGIVGMGGGIFLAPLLTILRWGTAREIAATAAGFVMVTSVAALAGHLIKSSDMFEFGSYIYLYPAVLIGGLIGSRLGARRLSVGVVRGLTAVLVLFVSANLFHQVFMGWLS